MQQVIERLSHYYKVGKVESVVKLPNGDYAVRYFMVFDAALWRMIAAGVRFQASTYVITYSLASLNEFARAEVQS